MGSMLAYIAYTWYTWILWEFGDDFWTTLSRSDFLRCAWRTGRLRRAVPGCLVKAHDRQRGEHHHVKDWGLWDQWDVHQLSADQEVGGLPPQTLSHTTLSHTVLSHTQHFHTQLIQYNKYIQIQHCHIQLCHTRNITHNSVRQHSVVHNVACNSADKPPSHATLSHTRLSHPTVLMYPWQAWHLRQWAGGVPPPTLVKWCLTRTPATCTSWYW